MKRSQYLMLPGGVYIIGGVERFTMKTEREIRVSIDEFELASLDCKTKKITWYFPGEKPRLESSFAFTPGKAGCLFFSIESELSHLAYVDALIEQSLKDLPVDRTSVGISVSELLNNAFVEAKKRSLKIDVDVSVLYIPERQSLIISVTDQLGRLSLEALPESFGEPKTNAKLNDHGRGLLIVGALMEYLSYNPTDDASGFKELLIHVPLNDNQH